MIYLKVLSLVSAFETDYISMTYDLSLCTGMHAFLLYPAHAFYKYFQFYTNIDLWALFSLICTFVFQYRIQYIQLPYIWLLQPLII